jgi:hypothetical protein
VPVGVRARRRSAGARAHVAGLPGARRLAPGGRLSAPSPWGVRPSGRCEPPSGRGRPRGAPGPHQALRPGIGARAAIRGSQVPGEPGRAPPRRPRPPLLHHRAARGERRGPWSAPIARRALGLPGRLDRPPLQAAQDAEVGAVRAVSGQGLEGHPYRLGQHGAPPHHPEQLAGSGRIVRQWSPRRPGQPPPEGPRSCPGVDAQHRTAVYDHQHPSASRWRGPIGMTAPGRERRSRVFPSSGRLQPRLRRKGCAGTRAMTMTRSATCSPNSGSPPTSEGGGKRPQR